MVVGGFGGGVDFSGGDKGIGVMLKKMEEVKEELKVVVEME